MQILRSSDLNDPDGSALKWLGFLADPAAGPNGAVCALSHTISSCAQDIREKTGQFALVLDHDRLKAIPTKAGRSMTPDWQMPGASHWMAAIGCSVDLHRVVDPVFMAGNDPLPGARSFILHVFNGFVIADLFLSNSTTRIGVLPEACAISAHRQLALQTSLAAAERSLAFPLEQLP